MMNNKSTIPLIAALLASTITGCATSGIETPSVIEASSGETSLMTVAAHGVQIYECRPAAGATPAWTFVAPEADLFDAEGRRIGTHGAGPFWQHQDGSRFVGTVRARADAPRSNAIPWLLLAASSKGPDGTFSRVSSVQRVNTVGGQPPGDGCDTASLGKRIHMAYRADYVLYVRRP